MAGGGPPVGQHRRKTRRGRSMGIYMLRQEVDQLAYGLVDALVLLDAEQRPRGRVHELYAPERIDSHDALDQRTEDDRQFVGETGKFVGAHLDHVLEVFAITRKIFLDELRFGDVARNANRHQHATFVIAQRRFHRVESLNQSVRPGNRFVGNVEHLTAREHVMVVADVLLGVVGLVEIRVDALVEQLVRHPVVVAKRLVRPEDARPRAFDEHHVRDGVEDLPIHLLLVEESAFAAVAGVRHLCYDRRRPYRHCAPNEDRHLRFPRPGT